MNRGKKPLTQANQKKIRKAVHAAQKEYPVQEEASSPSEKTFADMIKKFPKMLMNKMRWQLFGSQAPKHKKNKSKKKVSKRTEPGLMAEEPPRTSVNKEGRRWAKTERKQIDTQNVINQRHAAKIKK